MKQDKRDDAKRILAIGDIHGCPVAFEALLEAVNPGTDDLVIMLGDYVDRGPDSKEVVDRLIRPITWARQEYWSKELPPLIIILIFSLWSK